VSSAELLCVCLIRGNRRTALYCHSGKVWAISRDPTPGLGNTSEEPEHGLHFQLRTLRKVSPVDAVDVTRSVLEIVVRCRPCQGLHILKTLVDQPSIGRRDARVKVEVYIVVPFGKTVLTPASEDIGIILTGNERVCPDPRGLQCYEADDELRKEPHLR